MSSNLERAAAVASAWRSLEERLEAEKLRIYEEIQKYPPPIPACDVQFNFLLEQRTGVCRELDRMLAAREEGWRSGDPVSELKAFLQELRHVDDETKQQIVLSLQEP